MHSPNIRSGPISLEIRDKDYLLNHVDSVLNTKAFIQSTHALSSTTKTIPTTTKNPTNTTNTSTLSTTATPANTVNVISAKINSNRTTPASSTITPTLAKSKPTAASSITENKWDRMNNADISYNRKLTEDHTHSQQRHSNTHSQSTRYSRHQQHSGKSDAFAYREVTNSASSSSDEGEEERYLIDPSTAKYDETKDENDEDGDDEEIEEGEFDEEYEDISTKLPSNLVQFHFEFGSKRPPGTIVLEENNHSNTISSSDSEDDYSIGNIHYGNAIQEVDREILTDRDEEEENEEEIDIYNLSTDDEQEEEQKRWLGDTKYFPSATEEAIQTYETIKENIYIGSATGRSMAEESMPCQCKYKQNPCDDDNKCINRMMFMECMVQDCPCGRLCKNRRFQLSQYAPVDVIRTEKKGYGLRALTSLPANSFILEYIGEVIPQKEFLRRTREYDAEGYKHYYFMTLKNDEIIDATKKGCLARFINHSCNPNCVTQKWVIGKKMRIGIFTNRKITAGEELTFDYKFERYGATAQICYCGEPNCKGYIGASAAEVSIMEVNESAAAALRIKRNRDFQRRQYLLQRQQKRQQDYNHQHLKIFSSSSEGEFEDDILDEDDENDDEENMDTDEEEEDIDTQPLQDVNKVHFFVKRMLNSVGNARLVNKLLNRLEITNVKNSLGREIFKSIIRLHGLKMFKFWLGEWKNDETIVLKVLQVLDKLPLTNRNGLDDCKLLDVVQKLVDYNSSEVSVLAQLLLDKWNKLKVVYRIPKRSHSTATNQNNSATATPSSEISHWTEDVEKKLEDLDDTTSKEDTVEREDTKEANIVEEITAAEDNGEIAKALEADDMKFEREDGDIEIDIVGDDSQSELMDISSIDERPDEEEDDVIKDTPIKENGLESIRKVPTAGIEIPSLKMADEATPKASTTKEEPSRVSIPQSPILQSSGFEPFISELPAPIKTSSPEEAREQQKEARKYSASQGFENDSKDTAHRAKRLKNARYESSREFFESDTDYYEYFPVHCNAEELKTISTFVPLITIPNAPKTTVLHRSRYTTHRSATYTNTLTPAISRAPAAHSVNMNDLAATDNYTLLLQQQAAEQQKKSLSLYNSTDTSYYDSLYYPTTDTNNNMMDYSSYYYQYNYDAHSQQPPSETAASVPLSTWQTAFSENGVPYYYNLITHQTQWEMPEELQKLQNLIPPPPPPPLIQRTAEKAPSPSTVKTEEVSSLRTTEPTPADPQQQSSPSPLPAQHSEQQPSVPPKSVKDETFVPTIREGPSSSDQHTHGSKSNIKRQSTPTPGSLHVFDKEESNTVQRESNNDTASKPLTFAFNNDGLDEVDLKMEVGKIVTKYLSSRQQVLWNGDKHLFKDLARKITHFIVDREIQLGRKIRCIDTAYRNKIERFIDVYGAEYVAKSKQNA